MYVYSYEGEKSDEGILLFTRGGCCIFKTKTLQGVRAKHRHETPFF
jgi:hypothetical protein